MAAVDLLREYKAVVERAWGYSRRMILQYLRNNLPTDHGTLGNDLQFPENVSLAGEKLCATGRLRDSYYEATLVPGSVSQRSGRISEFRTDVRYASLYANGIPRYPTYHGFDFIEQTRRDIESVFGNKIVIP